MDNSKNITSREALKQAKDILAQGDWCDDYQFRSSEYFFMRDLKAKSNLSKKKIEIVFTLEYKTKSHRVINNITWGYPYEKIKQLGDDMEKLEKDIMLNAGDLDRKDLVFGKRFNKKLFEELGYEEKGWIIKR